MHPTRRRKENDSMRKVFRSIVRMALLLNGQFVFGQSAQTVAAAKKEGGKAILYTSLETFTADAIKAAFEKKTGLQMEYWRGGSTEVLDRVLSEHRVGKPGLTWWRSPAITCA